MIVLFSVRRTNIKTLSYHMKRPISNVMDYSACENDFLKSEKRKKKLQSNCMRSELNLLVVFHSSGRTLFNGGWMLKWNIKSYHKKQSKRLWLKFICEYEKIVLIHSNYKYFSFYRVFFYMHRMRSCSCCWWYFFF